MYEKKGYTRVGMPLEARCFLMSFSVPYQLNAGVSWPIRGRCTLAEKKRGEIKYILVRGFQTYTC